MKRFTFMSFKQLYNELTADPSAFSDVRLAMCTNRRRCYNLRVAAKLDLAHVDMLASSNTAVCHVLESWGAAHLSREALLKYLDVYALLEDWYPDANKPLVW